MALCLTFCGYLGGIDAFL